jgi:hypothetical protein
MPYMKDDEWHWGNLHDKDKDKLRKKVWGVWHKLGEKGDFSKFWETGKESKEK